MAEADERGEAETRTKEERQSAYFLWRKEIPHPAALTTTLIFREGGRRAQKKE